MSSHSIRLLVAEGELATRGVRRGGRLGDPHCIPFRRSVGTLAPFHARGRGGVTTRAPWSQGVIEVLE